MSEKVSRRRSSEVGRWWKPREGQTALRLVGRRG